MTEAPYQGRATIVKVGHSLEIFIPARKNWFQVIFVAAWLGGWFMGESSALDKVLSEDSPGPFRWFLLFWLVGWTIGGVLMLALLLWQIGGKETIVVEEAELELGKHLFGLGHYKNYKIADIRHLAINPPKVRNQQHLHLAFPGYGTLAFDYGLKTIQFGGPLDTAEARHLLELLRQNIHFKEGNFK